MVNDVIVNDTMKQMLSDKAERSIHGAQSTFQIRPGRSFIMMHIIVSVVEVRDCNCVSWLVVYLCLSRIEDLPIQWFIHKYGIPYSKKTFQAPSCVDANHSAHQVMTRPMFESNTKGASLEVHRPAPGSK